MGCRATIETGEASGRVRGGENEGLSRREQSVQLARTWFGIGVRRTYV